MLDSLGILALQGDFAEHAKVVRALGREPMLVRSPQQLESVEELIIPGGESTTILKLLDRFELRELLVKKLNDGMPAFGTCAGAIILAKEANDGEKPLGALDITVERNAYGRQNDSFEAAIAIEALGGTEVTGVFIRAPRITRVGENCRVLATWAEFPAAVQQGGILATTFHPEISGDFRLHQYFLDIVCKGS